MPSEKEKKRGFRLLFTILFFSFLLYTRYNINVYLDVWDDGLSNYNDKTGFLFAYICIIIQRLYENKSLSSCQ